MFCKFVSAIAAAVAAALADVLFCRFEDTTVNGVDEAITEDNEAESIITRVPFTNATCDCGGSDELIETADVITDDSF